MADEPAAISAPIEWGSLRITPLFNCRRSSGIVAFAMTPDRDEAARALLAFYQEAGVDALVGETPVNRLGGDPPSESAAAPARQPRASSRRRPSGASGRGSRGARPAA